MSQLEYLIALISIIIGLGLTDLARSLRDLIRPGRPVRWHWLPLTWTAIVFMLVVQLWWNSFEVLQRDLFADAVAFLPFLLMFLVLYLACSFALPDPGWEETGPSDANHSSNAPLDLEIFYFSASHRRGFFGTMVGLLALAQLISISFPLLEGTSPGAPGNIAVNVGTNVGALVLFAGLIVTDRWWYHAGVTILALAAVAATLAVGIPPLQ